MPETTEPGKHSYQSFCIFVENRDRIMKQMREEGIEVQIGTYAIHMHPAFEEGDRVIHKVPFNNSLYAYNHCLTLPLYHELLESDQQAVVDKLDKAYDSWWTAILPCLDNEQAWKTAPKINPFKEQYRQQYGESATPTKR